MANSLGALRISLGLDAVEFTSGLSKSEYQAKQSAEAIKRGFEGIAGSIKGVAGLIGSAFGVHEIAAWGQAIVANAEELHKLSIETGSSIENISKLENRAAIAGTSFEELKIMVDRFSAGMSGADSKGTRVAEVLKLLGVSTRDPAQAVFDLATKLNTFADGANKAALARDAFGRGGVAFLAGLQAIGNEQDIAATKTKEQIDKAVELAETYRKLVIASHELRDAFLQDVVPALTVLVQNFADAKSRASGLLGTLLELARTHANPFADAGDNLKYANEQVDQLKAKIANPTFLGMTFGTDQLKKELVEAERVRDLASSAYIRSVGGAPTNERIGGPKPQAPLLPPKGSVDDAAKKILDAQLAELRAFAEREKALLSLRNEVDAGLYDQGLISLKTFGENKKAAIEQDLQNTLRGYQQEQRLIKEQISKPGISDGDRAEAQKKLTESTQRYTLAVITGSKEYVKAENDNIKATREFQNSISELNAQILEMNGNTAEATAVRLKFQNEPQHLALRASGETRADAQLTFIEQQKTAQSALSDERRKYALITDRLGIAQARVDLAVQTGAISEIDALNQKSKLNRDLIGILSAQADAAERAAQSLTGVAKDDAIAHIARMRLEIDQLRAQTDLLADSIRKTFQSDFENAFTSFIDGSKSAKESFKDFAKSVQHDLSAIASKQIASQLFGTGGGGGSVGASGASWLASLFGGGGGGSSPPLGDAAAAGFSGGGFANGTDYARGGWSMVGERGPEAMFVPRGAQIIPNERLSQMRAQRGGATIMQTINVMPGASRMSADQAAAQSARMATRALQRNG